MMMRIDDANVMTMMMIRMDEANVIKLAVDVGCMHVQFKNHQVSQHLAPLPLV